MSAKKIPRVLVVGDLMIDHYLWGKCDRISPEAPVQVIEVMDESVRLGGACNVVHNLSALDCEVSTCGVIGKDENGRLLKDILLDVGSKVDGLIAEEHRKTTKKSRVIASRQQVVRVDRESKYPIEVETVDAVLSYIKNHAETFDICILSDYGKGLLSDALTQDIITFCASKNKKVLIDPKGKDYSKYRGGYLITPNKKEASIASDIDIIDDESLEAAGFKLKNELDLDIAIITLSEDGMAIFEGETMTKIPTVAREVYDVTGAGDTVIASLAYYLGIGEDIYEACHFANSAAAVVVGKIGSATATLEEINEYQHSIRQTGAELKIKTFEQAEKLAKKLKNMHKKIVFTNGCFDILHTGHVRYLHKAKELGDILVLGLNSDASVQRLKGEGRPINGVADRAEVLASLESVDYVIEFTEDTPYELIKKIEPDVLVKGADYAGKEVVGSDIAKQTILIEFVEGRSTTSIIKKIKG